MELTTKEEKLERIHHKKKFFIQSFIVSLILLIIVCILAALTFNLQAVMAERLYALDVDDYGKCVLMGLTLWKVLIVQFTLVPAIVMHMIEKHVKNEMHM